MRHQDVNKEWNEGQKDRQCSFGMIYLSWSKRFTNDMKKQGEERHFQQYWREFANLETAEWFQSTLLEVKLKWISHDLFIAIKLPEGKHNRLEDWLLEMAFRETKEWEQRFLNRYPTVTMLGAGNRLHIGVAVVAMDECEDEDTIWYECSKRAILHGQSADAMERSLRLKAFHRLLTTPGNMYPAYQPIISLGDNHVFGYEALTRFHDRSWFDGPSHLFQFADNEGELYTLDRMARENAIDQCSRLEHDQKLFINVMAQIMEDPKFAPGQTISMLEQQHLKPQHVVFEITERSSIADYPAVKRALEHYRNQGYQIAIDDVGAGYSSLQSIVELRPDYLKVDRSIIQNIHLDDMKRHVLHTLMEIGSKMNIAIIAEGIELEEELQLLRELGVHYAQGYLLGKPAPFL